jgi:hypothetical protein
MPLSIDDHNYYNYSTLSLLCGNIFAYPVLGDQVLDFNNGGVPRHLGQIADKMSEWEGPIADQLGLIPADVAAISKQYPDKLNLQT